MASTSNSADQFMHEEIHRLAAFIADAKREIFNTRDSASEQVITDASQHLDEVLKTTEQASNAIMDAADSIQQHAAGIGGDKEKHIMEASGRIYEACNFQDLTGQRITKVIRLLTAIEERIGKLNALFNTAETAAPAAPLTDKDLLNGPQLAANAPSQDDIDKLFTSLGGKN